MDCKISSCCLSVQSLYPSMCAHSASTQNPSLHGNFPGCLRLTAQCWHCSNMCCSHLGALSNFLSVVLPTDLQSMLFPKAAHEIALFQGGARRFPCLAEHSLLLSLPRTLGANAAACLNAALWPSAEISCVAATVPQVCITFGMLPQIEFSLLYMGFDHLGKCPGC